MVPISPARLERKADRQDEIVRSLRDQIVFGELRPGTRLPNRLEIEQNFGASSVTVQRALERLKDEGFVVASRRNGTFVVDQPPHLSHFALAFPSERGAAEWNQFWESLCHAARRLETQGSCRFPSYYGIDMHADSRGYRDLEQAVKQHRLAGIIYTSNPNVLRNTSVLQQKDVPTVAITAGNSVGVPYMTLDIQSMVELALDRLVAMGRRRVAVIKSTGLHYDFQAAIHARGLQTHSYWIQDISLWAPETARGVAHLLMNPAQLEHPDAIFIADDNLLPPVIQGVQEAGVQVPTQLTLVSHCNFPTLQSPRIPVVRVGFDVGAVLEGCLELVTKLRAGEPVPFQTQLKARYEL